MTKRLSVLFAQLALVSGSVAAQPPPGYVDPHPVLQAAVAAIGADQLQCVTISGSGYTGIVGQQRLSAYEVDWPRGEALTHYTRTMNWAAGTMVEAFDREPGHNPTGWKYGLGWAGRGRRSSSTHAKRSWSADRSAGTGTGRPVTRLSHDPRMPSAGS